MVDALRVLIVDDEPLARDAVRLCLDPLPGFEVVGEVSGGEEAVDAIREGRPDIVFLDVRMPEVDGFEVLRRVGRREDLAVVFVTAFGDHAVQAFESDAVDYVVKPFSDDRLIRSARRAARRLAVPPASRGADEPSLEYAARFTIRTRRRIYFVPSTTIGFVTSSGNYVTLHAGGREHLLRMTMVEMERRLDPSVFARVHRSTIVNLNRVVEVRPLPSGDYEVVLTTGTILRMSRRYRERVLGT